MSCLFLRIRASLSAIASSEASLCPMSGWVCQRKPFWIPGRRLIQESLYGKSGCSSEMYLLKDQAPQITVKSSSRLLRVSKLASSSLWEPAKLHDKACFWERIGAPLLPLRPRLTCGFIHLRQLNYFPERLVLPFSNEVIMSWLRRTRHFRK